MATTTPRLTDPRWLRRAHAGIADAAVDDLRGLWQGLNLGDPRRSRDQLLRHVPAITGEYGEMTAVASADWYDELRAAERVPGRFRAGMADPFPAEFVQQRVRYGAAHLFTATPESMLPFLAGVVQEYVLQPGRDSIQQSAVDDPEASGWHRETAPGACGFCRMLAGRGGVYRKSTAAFAAHGDCRCTARPSWDADAPEVPVSAYVASERMDKLRERAAIGDASAQSQLDDHRQRVRGYVEAMDS